ncbi:GIY-YIG nuclease family protein [Nonlabens sp.]|uniref:GIY-YIG nuclease family protein n=1 Tax=Nonlabens sp. TaxID=1888209 RepID=UPI003F6A2A48
MYFVYMMFSESLDVYYKGSTSNIQERFLNHLNGKSKYTSKTNDWELVFIREFSTKSEALKNEKMLKRQHRKYLTWAILQDYNIIKSFTF